VWKVSSVKHQATAIAGVWLVLQEPLHAGYICIPHSERTSHESARLAWIELLSYTRTASPPPSAVCRISDRVQDICGRSRSIGDTKATGVGDTGCRRLANAL